MTTEMRRAIRRGITEFFETTPEGERFSRQTGLLGVRPVTEAELKALDHYAPDHRRLLEGGALSRP
ncbi:MAG: hypothetical protein ABI794_13075 [Betaproteobacteria bacterium]